MKLIIYSDNPDFKPIEVEVAQTEWTKEVYLIHILDLRCQSGHLSLKERFYFWDRTKTPYHSFIGYRLKLPESVMERLPIRGFK